MGNSDRPAKSGRKRSSQSGRKRLAARAGGVDDGWQDAWEEFVAAFAKHCDLGKFNHYARKKLRAAFGKSVGKAVKKNKKKWRENGQYTPYAQFVIDKCAADLGQALDTEPEPITTEILTFHAVTLTRAEWKKACPDPAAEVVTPADALGKSCDDLLDFFEDRAGAISRRRL